jgi:hypothetical protein
MRFPVMIAALVLAGSTAMLPPMVPSAWAANSPPPITPATTPMLAHRALYILTMGPPKGQDVVAARGTMAYEVTDACDAWIVRQRLRMTVTNADGEDVEMTSDYATWEAKDGLRLRFHMRQTTDTAVTSQTDGEAKLDRVGGPGEAHYTSPKDQTLKLPAGTVFPMMHTETILAASRQKQHFLNLPLFDGTDDNGIEDSFIIVLDQKPPSANPFPILASLASTKVHLSFFDHDLASMMPTYEVTMRYWENGVADDMAMDFGDFVMNAKIKEFAPQPRKC